MTVFPDVQARARDEIRRVIRSDRLPKFSDRESLPIIDGLVWESLRWNPVTPLGLQHMTSKDDNRLDNGKEDLFCLKASHRAIRGQGLHECCQSREARPDSWLCAWFVERGRL